MPKDPLQLDRWLPVSRARTAQCLRNFRRWRAEGVPLSAIMKLWIASLPLPPLAEDDLSDEELEAVYARVLAEAGDEEAAENPPQ